MAHHCYDIAEFLLLTFTILLSNSVKITSREALEIGNRVDRSWTPHNTPPNCSTPTPPPPPPPPKCSTPSPPPPPPKCSTPSPPPPPPPPKCSTPSPPPPPPKCSTPPPPPPTCPKPSPLSLDLDPCLFVDIRIYRAYKVIQQFKVNITSDEQNITNSWVGADVCGNYTGFYCDNPPDNKSAIALAAIDFNGFKLGAASVSEFISQLKDLAFFHANSNNFGGTITADVAKLPYLYELDLSNNKLTGSFPLDILNVVNLTFLDIRFNSFVGSVPFDLFNLQKLPKLEVLFLNNNNFSLQIPDSIGQTSVKYLTLANNQLTGGIPRSIGNLSNTLVEVLLLNNQLSGCLPYEIGLLERATVFDVGNNWLTGPLPCSLGCLKSVEQLNFAGNYLYGHIPEVVCQLGNLLNLSLSDNYFTWVGPACEELIWKGVLDARKNCIPGRPLQRSPEECFHFFSKPLQCHHWPWYDYIPCNDDWASAPSNGPSPASNGPSPASNGNGPSPASNGPSPAYSPLFKQRS
ncbi:uncharacterized protein At4g06744-like [Magnolia sinica]|uniref:uncharacterized protein At4g06744-like n=1 Tax=Magnolia sinica TaxID=86752 RepID=UPI00265AE43A|nr:uncharacterized protein At4g06744-like [Magnolia sinica]